MTCVQSTDGSIGFNSILQLDQTNNNTDAILE